MQIEEKIIVQFLFVESILIYIHDLQYCVKIPPPTSIGGKAKATPSCPWWNDVPYLPTLAFVVPSKY